MSAEAAASVSGKRCAADMGRPSDYSEELAEFICDQIADGKSLRTICLADDIPNRSTVLRWLDVNAVFAAKYARAREAQGDVMDEMIADEARAATPETAAVARVRIDAYKWRASKLAPKRYGDKVALTGDADNPIHTKHTQVIDVTSLSTDALKELARLAAPDNG